MSDMPIHKLSEDLGVSYHPNDAKYPFEVLDLNLVPPTGISMTKQEVYKLASFVTESTI